MTRHLFGTDGVRGVAGELLSAELALALGRAATARVAKARAASAGPVKGHANGVSGTEAHADNAHSANRQLNSVGSSDVNAHGVRGSAGRPQVLIIRDTRESGEMLQAALAAGVSAAGGDALLGGVLPTPAAPLLIARYGFDLAAVISASHNPYQDNGIKFFGADGFKLSDKDELEIEHALERMDAGGVSSASAVAQGDAAQRDDADAKGEAAELSAGGKRLPAIGQIRELRGTHEDYLRELHTRFRDLNLDGLDVLLDCANGATHHVAPEIFRRLGANVSVVADSPDGRNINAGCGSTHVELLAEQVRAGAHVVGFAFDGDGDRVLAVDGAGEVVDGDELMALAALHLKRTGRLTGGGVAVTVMTNYGFHAAMRDAEIDVEATKVGDRYVLEALRERGWVLGGEQSGHIIDMGFNRSGDGIASALLALEALDGRPLSERDAMAKLPQRLVNVRVRDREALDGAQVVTDAVRAADDALSGRGRVLVRPSGTEPLVRVMVEAPTDDEAESVCARLVALVERELA
jgi:phosphoglucosamine mutase